MDQAAEMAQAVANDGEMSQTEFMIRVSYNYHKKRERFFRIVDASTKVLSLVAITSLASIGGWFSLFLAVSSGAATILSVVLDFAGMAGKHESLARQFLKLIGSLAAQKMTIQEAALKRAEVEALEPSSLRGLVQVCSDEEDAARGIPVEPERLAYWRRIKAHFGFGEMPIPSQ